MFVGTQSKDIWTLKALLWTRISPPIFFHAWLLSTCFKTTISENDTLDTTVWVHRDVQTDTSVCEHSSAFCTTLWFLTCVSFHVTPQMTVICEHFPACFAMIRFLTSVRSYVPEQLTSVCEHFPACFTTIWFLTCVCSYVHW